MAKVTLDNIKMAKSQGQKLTMLTCYDYSFAKLIDAADIDMILVGDSLGTVIKGENTTTKVTIDEMIYHCKCVRQGVTRSFLLADMPFGTYQISTIKAKKNIYRLMNETNVDGVKLEGGMEICKTVKELVKLGIPIMGHIGLTPQTASSLGGFKVQGKDKNSAQKILENALRLQDAGAFSIVLECVISEVSELITQKLSIPTIGIGAGNACDGQVLVLYDMLGLYGDKKLKFVRRYADLSGNTINAVKNFIKDIKNGDFPNDGESFKSPDKDYIRNLAIDKEVPK